MRTITGEQATQPAIASASAKFCGQCRQFAPDTVGDGTGIGHCTDDAVRYPALVWPRTEACERFEAEL